MSEVKFMEIDPLEAHDCLHCQHLYLEITDIDTMARTYACDHFGEALTGRDLIRQNDCLYYSSIWANDFKRR